MVKSADTPVLGTGSARSGGSSPSATTIVMNDLTKTHKGKPLKEATYRELWSCLKWYNDTLTKYPESDPKRPTGLTTHCKDMIPVVRAEMSNRIGKQMAE